MKFFRPVACSLLLAACWAAPAAAEKKFSADYSVTLFGLPVASASFTSTFAGDGSVTVEGSMRSAGLARLLDSTRGNTVARARIGSDEVEPTSFRAEYASGRRQNGVTMRFSNGDVTALEHSRPQRPRRSNWVPITQSHLRSVVDPLTATMVRASSPEEVCNRTISGFDGWMRADLRLRPVSTGPIRGHQGIGAVCAASFQPVAGYYSDSRDIRHIRDRGEIRITFAPLGDTGVYAPVHASAGTRIGTLHITAGPIRTN
jgi:hypothetical protein